jgi:hypothetical protein
MPCYDPRDHGDFGQGYDEGLKAQKEEIDKLTRLLCEAMHKVENYIDPVAVCSKELLRWWELHKAWDLKRKGRKS